MENNRNFVTIQLMGGLGNMLFQIASAFSVSLRDNKYFFCDEIMNAVPHLHYSYYKNNILRKVIFSKKENIDYLHDEKKFSFEEIPIVNGNIEMRGYFQSEKYFNRYRNEISNLFEPSNEIKSYVDSFFNQTEGKKTCSLHVRRSNYLHLSDYHYIQNIDYYRSAVDIIGQDSLFLIFSDDLAWCKENLNFIKNKIFVENMKDFEEIYLMSNCDDNIIANSTFSWWGAWLNNKNNKKVISPSIWFGRLNKHLDTKDIYCENWIKI